MKISIGSGAIIIVSKRSQSNIPAVSEVVLKLRSIAVHLLARMYRPEERLFAFRLRRNGQGEILEGVSRRYTAIALIGLAGEDEHIVTQVLGNHSLEDVCDHLLKDIDLMEDLGEVALTTWAARMIKYPRTHKAIEALRRFDPIKVVYPTIELSWALTALIIESDEVTDMALARNYATVLMDSFNLKTAIFPHGPIRKGLSALCAHVSCFADFVYPIQALSYYYQVTKEKRAAEIACRCAEHMCELQGLDGQWWWHFDVRTGRTLEHYPVYSVHQDSMVPMVLSALSRACGQDHSVSIEKGLRWLAHPAEKTDSLIDKEHNAIWRSVARREPGRLVLGLQSAASYVHPAIRVPGVDVLFPPVLIDYESRPYHMGWILHAWRSNSEKKSERQTSVVKKKHPLKA
ncbi:hypothetical protein ACFL3Q_07135 [Planctomycetota bacterium]